MLNQLVADIIEENCIHDSISLSEVGGGYRNSENNNKLGSQVLGVGMLLAK